VSSSTSTPRLYQGRVLEASVKDKLGGNRKRRPLIIVTPTDEIQSSETFDVVCVTTQGEKYPSNYNVPIRGGNKLIGITWDSDIVCDWDCSIRETDVIALLGKLPPTILKRVLEKYDQYQDTLRI
jgi:hypothetical protein